MLLVILLLKHLRIQMMFLFLMLKLNLVMNPKLVIMLMIMFIMMLNLVMIMIYVYKQALSSLNQIRYVDGVEAPHLLDPGSNWSDSTIPVTDLATGVELNVTMRNIMDGTSDNLIPFLTDTPSSSTPRSTPLMVHFIG